MPALTMIAAVLLVVIGLVGYVNGTPNVETGKVSPTALIPAFIGVALGLLGLIALAGPGARKHAMHLAAMVGLVGMLGGFMPLTRQKLDEFDPFKPSAVSGELMILVCAAFVGLCVKSFIDARKARKAATQPATT